MDFNSKYKSSEIEAMLDKIKNFEGGGGKTAVVHHGTEDTTFEMTPDIVHEWDVIDSLTLTFPSDEDGYTNQYKAVFTAASDSFSLALPFYYKWVNDEVPTFEEGMQYEISFEGARVLWSKFNKPTKFGLIEYAENDGKDYVLTDIYPDSTFYGFRVKSSTLQDAASSASYGVAGTRNIASGSTNAPFCYYYHYSRGRLLYWSNKDVGTLGDYVKDEVYEDEYILASGIATDAQYPLTIFAVNSKGTIGALGAIRLYYLQFIDANGEVIIDLRPWRRKEDGHVGIMDIISNKFYESVNGNLVGA